MLTMPDCDAPGLPDALLDLTADDVKSICMRHRRGDLCPLTAIALGVDLDTVETVIAYVFGDEAGA